MAVIKTLKKIIGITTFCGFYFYEVLVSGLNVSLEVLSVKSSSKPGFIELPLEAKSSLEIALLSNLITFSPGSMVVDISPDRKFLCIHVMCLDSSEKEIVKIKSTLESRVLEILR